MVKRVLGVLALLVGVVLLLWGVVVWLIFTPEVVTPHIVGALQQYTKSEVSIKSVDLSLFNRFPNLTLKIDSLRITQTKDSIDDLLFARQCRVAINPFELFRNKNIAINHVSLQGAKIYMYVDSLHGPLKTFNLPENQEEDADSPDTLDMSDYRLTLKRLVVDSAQITIDDRRKQFYTRVENWFVDTSMDLTSSISNLEVKTGFTNLIVWQKGELLAKKIAMELRSQMIFDRDSMQLSFERARLRVNDIDLKTRGVLRMDSLSNGVYMDIHSTLNTPSLAEFLTLIPSSFIDGKEKITTQGEVLLDLDLKGIYSESSYPTIGATLKVDNAKAKYESRKLELERVDCDAYAFVDLNDPQNSYADVTSLHVNTSGIIDLTVSGKFTNIVEDAAVDINILSDINFDRFTEIFPLNEGVICKGQGSGDIDAQFKVSDIQSSNYADLYINGETKFTNLELTFDASKYLQDSTALASLYLQAESGLMLFGDNVIAQSNSRTLRAKMNFQDLNYRSKSGEYLAIKDVELIAGANFDRVSSKMNGVGIRGIAKNTKVSADSLFNANLESADISIIVKPKSEERNAVVNAIISSQEIAVDEPLYDANIMLSSVDLNITVERVAESRELKLGGKINSKQISIDEPNYNSKLNLSSVDLNFSLERDAEEQWAMEGAVAFSNFDMLSDVFPMNIDISETSVSIRDKRIYLDNAHLKLGESEIIATGNIQNLLRKLFVDPRASLSGALSIHAPMLDFGAIVEASNHSVLMLEEESDEESEYTQEVVEAVVAVDRRERREPQGHGRHQRDSMEMQRLMAEAGSMYIVPIGMDFVFDLNIDKALFWGGLVENFEGRATLKDGVLSLDKIELDAIGAKAVASMTYRNISRRSSNLAGDIALQSVDINRIGELLPSVYTMLPMIESFEGVVDFDLTGNVNMGNDSQIDISSLYSAMCFKGKNLVVMDGETFTDLSKKMMFKNKDRNIIDSLEVYVLVSESTVDVLPFSVSIDRYSAIVGGSQVVNPESLDMDYNYHVSVVKSPLPFKAGVDIAGNLEDFDIKITKAKLKKTDFDEQRMIYNDYCNSIEASEEALVDELEQRRLEMRNRRREQRSVRDSVAREVDKEPDPDSEEAPTTTPSQGE